MLDVNLFTKKINESNDISEEEILMRELIEICSIEPIIDINIIRKFNSNTFIKVQKELYRHDYKDSKLLKDMVNGTHMMDNLDAIRHDVTLDDDEIY